jgi:hypothetical protein
VPRTSLFVTIMQMERTTERTAAEKRTRARERMKRMSVCRAANQHSLLYSAPQAAIKGKGNREKRNGKCLEGGKKSKKGKAMQSQICGENFGLFGTCLRTHLALPTNSTSNPPHQTSSNLPDASPTLRSRWQQQCRSQRHTTQLPRRNSRPSNKNSSPNTRNSSQT